MKGIVFTEFLALVEEKFGYETVDSIINDAKVSNNGAYTSIGTYPHEEMISLVVALSNKVNIDVQELLLIYGNYFFDVLKKNYGHYLTSFNNAFDMFCAIENHIHVEVKKLYPDAELPTFEIIEKTDKQLEMIYKSSRKLYSFAEGLIQGTLSHFKQTGLIEKTILNENGSEVKFEITIQ